MCLVNSKKNKVTLLVMRSFLNLLGAARACAINVFSIWGLGGAELNLENHMKKTLRIATRKSPLAMWQAEFVKAELEKVYPELEIILLPMSTKGDKILDVPLAKIGGKGLFTKELEDRMMDGDADIAIHSMKDVPMELPEGFALGALMERHSPTDAFISNTYASFDELPQGAILGTSSLRRKAQLMAVRPDLDVRDLRGNVGTRLGKLDAGEYDAIVLATSGLQRLGLDDRIRHEISPEICLPAVTQGTLGIEYFSKDTETLKIIRVLNHDDSEIRAIAERAMNHRLEGVAKFPLACLRSWMVIKFSFVA